MTGETPITEERCSICGKTASEHVWPNTKDECSRSWAEEKLEHKTRQMIREKVAQYQDALARDIEPLRRILFGIESRKTGIVIEPVPPDETSENARATITTLRDDNAKLREAVRKLARKIVIEERNSENRDKPCTSPDTDSDSCPRHCEVFNLAQADDDVRDNPTASAAIEEAKKS